MAGTYKSGSAARSYVASNEQLGGIIYNDLGAFESLPVVAGDTAVMVDTKAILSASFLSHSGSVIQALNFLKASSDAGSGDVVGPDSATDNAVARFDLTTGKLLQNSTLLVSDGASPTIGIAADADLLTIANAVLTVAGEVTAATYESAGSAFAVDAAGAVTAVGIAAGGAISTATSIDASGDLTVGSITMTEFAVDSSGNTDVDGTLNVEGVPTFQAAAVFSSGISAANAIAGATTIDASGDLTVGTITNAEFAVDADGNTDIDGTLNVEGVPTFQAAAVFSSGISAAGSIAGATSIDGSGDLTMGTVTMSGFSVDADGDTSAKSLVSTTTISGTAGITGNTFTSLGGGAFGTLNVGSNAFIVDGSGNATSANGLASFGGAVSSSIGLCSNRMLMTGSGHNIGLRASGTIMIDSTPANAIQIGASAAGAGINDIPYIQMMGVDAGGLLQEYKFQVSGGILQVNEV
jgi:hypothetical protein